MESAGDRAAHTTTLVTGATGFIGSRLVTALARDGTPVRCLVRPSSPRVALDYLRGLGAEIAGGDLTDRASLAGVTEGVETVFHLGGGGALHMPEDLCVRINVEGTRNLLDACDGVRTFVHASTCGVMGHVANPPADETHPCRPEDYVYARAKVEAEKVALARADRVPVVVVRFPMVYGPPVIRDDPARVAGVSSILAILSLLRNRRWVYVGDGQTLMHWIHVDDLVRGLRLAAERGRRGEVYILADRAWTTTQQMIEATAKALGAEIPRRHVPVPVARLAATVAGAGARLLGRVPRLSRELVNAFLVNRAFSIAKARRELGFEPQVPFDEGMRGTVRWFEQHGYLQPAG